MLTCDDGGNRFRENDRQRDVFRYITSTTTIYYKLQLLQMRALSRQTNKSPEGWVGKTLRPNPRSPSIEKGCFSLSERRRLFRCLGDTVIHPSIANALAKCDGLPRQRRTTTTTQLLVI